MEIQSASSVYNSLTPPLSLSADSLLKLAEIAHVLLSLPVLLGHAKTHTTACRVCVIPFYGRFFLGAQILLQTLKKRGLKCRCMRCREVKGQEFKDASLIVRK